MSETNGAKPIDWLRGAFSRQLREFVVEPGHSLWFGPLTVGDIQDATLRKPKDDWERHMYVLVGAARDADGKPVFTLADIPALARDVPLEMLTRIVNFMYGGVVDAVAAAAAADAALKADPPSSST